MDFGLFIILITAFLFGFVIARVPPFFLRNWYWWLTQRLTRPATKADIERFGRDVEE